MTEPVVLFTLYFIWWVSFGALTFPIINTEERFVLCKATLSPISFSSESESHKKTARPPSMEMCNFFAVQIRLQRHVILINGQSIQWQSKDGNLFYSCNSDEESLLSLMDIPEMSFSKALTSWEVVNCFKSSAACGEKMNSLPQHFVIHRQSIHLALQIPIIRCARRRSIVIDDPSDHANEWRQFSCCSARCPPLAQKEFMGVYLHRSDDSGAPTSNL